MSRSVLVTGGNRGIGRAVATAFAEAGAKVAITYRTGEPPDGVLGVQCDVRDADSVRKAFTEVREAHGPIEVLVANAGVTRDGLLLAMPERDFTDVLDTNLMGTVRCVKEAGRDMVQSRWGRIILLSSTSGLAGSPGQTNYTSAKAALVGLARSLAWELGRRNITVNVVAPGYIDTDMTRSVSQKRRDAILAQTALGRYGTTDEVTGVIRFLASDSASYLTGAVIPVGGGLGMGH
jgi:3-oxoacyl-[acyl-carrier protein] reductase